MTPPDPRALLLAIGCFVLLSSASLAVDKNPGCVVLNLYDEHHKPTTLEPKSRPPPEGEAAITRSSGTNANGRQPGSSSADLAPYQQSYVGAQLRIPVPKGDPQVEVLKLKPTD